MAYNDKIDKIFRFVPLYQYLEAKLHIAKMNGLEPANDTINIYGMNRRCLFVISHLPMNIRSDPLVLVQHAPKVHYTKHLSSFPVYLERHRCHQLMLHPSSTNGFLRVPCHAVAEKCKENHFQSNLHFQVSSSIQKPEKSKFSRIYQNNKGYKI